MNIFIIAADALGVSVEFVETAWGVGWAGVGWAFARNRWRVVKERAEDDSEDVETEQTETETPTHGRGIVA